MNRRPSEVVPAAIPKDGHRDDGRYLVILFRSFVFSVTHALVCAQYEMVRRTAIKVAR